MLEKVPAVARSVQIGKTSSATNATVRCVAAKAGGRRREAGRRASEEAGRRGGEGVGRREGKQAGGRAHSGRKPSRRLSREYKPVGGV